MGKYEVFVADPHGFCTGVRRAIEIAQRALQEAKSENPKAQIYCLHELVHNQLVVSRLSQSGMVFVNDLSEVPDGGTVLFSAHGVSPILRNEASMRSLKVIDATCVFVNKVHESVRFYAEKGYTILLIGQKKHDEVVGTQGEASSSVIVVERDEDVHALVIPDESKVVVLMQTTLALYQVTPIVEAIRERFPQARIPDKKGICFATTERQEAVRDLAKKCNIILVLGSRGSANSNRLVDVAVTAGVKAHLISTIDDAKQLINSGVIAEHKKIGVTAGASTPEDFVLDVVNLLKMNRQ